MQRTHPDTQPHPDGPRRSFLRTASLAAFGMATAPAALGARAAMAQEAMPALTDVEILNFALHLEYVEAEYYLRAAYGTGLPEDLITGVGELGPVIGGSQVPFRDAKIRKLAEEIAQDELAHVRFLRTALGSAAIARPTINLQGSFTAAARAARLVGPASTFNPFQNDLAFLYGAYVFEDVGVTAYKGAAPLIQSDVYLEAAAGILAVEGYHAGAIRTILYLRGEDFRTRALSDLRDAVDGPEDLDQGVFLGGPLGEANITPTDTNGIAFSRTPAQVLSIITLGSPPAGGFLPDGINGFPNGLPG